MSGWGVDIWPPRVSMVDNRGVDRNLFTRYQRALAGILICQRNTPTPRMRPPNTAVNAIRWSMTNQQFQIQKFVTTIYHIPNHCIHFFSRNINLSLIFHTINHPICGVGLDTSKHKYVNTKLEEPIRISGHWFADNSYSVKSHGTKQIPGSPYDGHNCHIGTPSNKY